MRIVVIGGTGLIGSRLVAGLDEAGHDVTAASPDTGVNTLTGVGLADALEGASVVVDVSNSPSYDDAVVTEFFPTSTSNLLAAEAVAGVGHHLVLSIVGVERATGSAYYRAKRAQEELVRGSPIPYTIVHATQFFEFVTGIANAATDGETVRLPRVLVQPIAADDLAAVLSELAQGPPVDDIVEVAGPQQFRLDELVRGRLKSQDDPRTVVADPTARYFGAELGERTLLPGKSAHEGETRFHDWLTQLVSRAEEGVA
jgi:uncharacterized protein YbjT (DUF2867 family)